MLSNSLQPGKDKENDDYEFLAKSWSKTPDHLPVSCFWHAYTRKQIKMQKKNLAAYKSSE